MKDLYRNLFRIILICAIITLIFSEIFFLNLIAVTGQISNKTFQDAQELTTSGKEISDMAGYGALANYVGSGFTKIIQIIFIFLSIAMFIFVAIYLLLYYIASREFKNGESKNKMIISIILVSIAVLMKMYFVFEITKILFNIAMTDFNMLFNWENVLILIPYISEIVSVIFTIIFYIRNLVKIEKIYNERIEEKNEN